MAIVGIRQSMLQALRDQSYANGQIQFKVGQTEFAGTIESVLLGGTGPLNIYFVSLAKKVDGKWKYLKLKQPSDRHLKWDVSIMQTLTVFDRILTFLGEADVTIRLVPEGHTAIIPLPERKPPTE